jgi:predicted cupin superfamily sugar epimerase
MTDTPDADAVIAALGLAPHPEGGYFRETWRDESDQDREQGRGHGTAIYYLLKAGEVSAWHRIDATEIWHYYAGAPLALTLRREGQETRQVLGPDIAAGARPQLTVPAHAWQTAQSLGAWTLVGCTVSPAFEFEGFEMAPESGPTD